MLLIWFTLTLSGNCGIECEIKIRNSHWPWRIIFKFIQWYATPQISGFQNSWAKHKFNLIEWKVRKRSYRPDGPPVQQHLLNQILITNSDSFAKPLNSVSVCSPTTVARPPHTRQNQSPKYRNCKFWSTLQTHHSDTNLNPYLKTSNVPSHFGRGTWYPNNMGTYG